LLIAKDVKWIGGLSITLCYSIKFSEVLGINFDENRQGERLPAKNCQRVGDTEKFPFEADSICRSGINSKFLKFFWEPRFRNSVLRGLISSSEIVTSTKQHNSIGTA
jgi:hypothetical protein